MIPDDQHQSLEDEVRDLLEAAGWGESSTPDDGRIEVIAYRAGLEAARMTPSGPTCCAAPIQGGALSGPERAADAAPDPDPDPDSDADTDTGPCTCGSSLSTPARRRDDRPDPDSCTGSTRA